MKRLGWPILVLTCILLISHTSAQGTSHVKDNILVSMNVAWVDAQRSGQEALVPLFAVARIGLEAHVEAATGKITLEKSGMVFRCRLGSTRASINGKPLRLSAAPRIQTLREGSFFEDSGDLSESGRRRKVPFIPILAFARKAGFQVTFHPHFGDMGRVFTLTPPQSTPPPSRPASSNIRLQRVVLPDTRRMGASEIKARLSFGNHGVFDLEKIAPGDWTDVSFVITNHGDKPLLVSDEYLTVEGKDGAHFADQSFVPHGNPYVAMRIMPKKTGTFHVGWQGRLSVKRIVYMDGWNHLEWKCAPNDEPPATTLAANASDPVHYTITDLGTLGGSNSAAEAINDNGDIAGNTDTVVGVGGPRCHACLWHEGKIIDLGEGYAHDINQRGQVVGRSGENAFLYEYGKTQTLQTRFGDMRRDGGEARAINDRGQIVGSTGTSWIWQDGQARPLLDVWVTGINNKGHLVGVRNFRPAFYANGKWRDLGTLGGKTGTAFLISDEDEVTGSATTGEIEDAGDDRAGSILRVEAPFLWRNGKMTRLQVPTGLYWKGKPPFHNTGKLFSAFPYVSDGRGGLRHFTQALPANSGWTELRAAAINNKGQIVGMGKINGKYRAFLMSPEQMK